MALGQHPYPETSLHYALYEMMMNQPSPSLAGVHGISPEMADFVNKWYFSSFSFTPWF